MILFLSAVCLLSPPVLPPFTSALFAPPLGFFVTSTVLHVLSTFFRASLAFRLLVTGLLFFFPRPSLSAPLSFRGCSAVAAPCFSSRPGFWLLLVLFLLSIFWLTSPFPPIDVCFHRSGPLGLPRDSLLAPFLTSITGFVSFPEPVVCTRFFTVFVALSFGYVRGFGRLSPLPGKSVRFHRLLSTVWHLLLSILCFPGLFTHYCQVLGSLPHLCCGLCHL